MTSVRLGFQPMCQRFPTLHQVADAHSFLGMARHYLSEHLHFVQQQAKRLLWLDRAHSHLLVLCKRVSGQDYAVEGGSISRHRAGFYEGNCR